ncbi:unnamed protein product [Cuscuta europaea]|uniref:Uncharacterized protein n=1 Tax=Cuscuta europaea TaxID=41803 RepID=A0A9P0Z8R6_CUSEU|nr:unnamed protein product [Cuscuta europaea]
MTVQGGNPTGLTPNPTGSRKQTAQGAGKAAEAAAADILPAQETADDVQTVKKGSKLSKKPAQGAGSAAEPAATDIQSAQGAGSAAEPAATEQSAQGHANGVQTVKDSKCENKCSDVGSEVIVEDIERVVTDENDLHQHDVVIKCEVINGKTLSLVVKPFRFVQASVIRVDTSLRLTDDLDNKGLTFTTKCFEGLPGYLKKKGEVCFGSKFTTIFREFFGC